MTDESEPQPVFEFADALMQAGKHCATLARAKTGKFFERGFVPNPDDPTATVTFILFEGKTYTVTAGHVMDIFEEAARVEGCYPEGYFVPARPGALIGPPFVRPPARFTDRAPDIALRPIDPALPASLGKRPFELQSSAVPIFPLSAALAIGFPTASKEVLKDSQGERLALLGVQAIAQGLGSPDTDQIQFWSEISERSLISKLSGMSGGPVFWSRGETHGLLGFVKEALDVEPQEGAETLSLGPKVNFICQRANYETFAAWAEYADREFPKLRRSD